MNVSKGVPALSKKDKHDAPVSVPLQLRVFSVVFSNGPKAK
jgi:hypothetical protein